MHDVKLFRLFSPAKQKTAGAWRNALAEAKKNDGSKQKKPEEPAVNLFEQARQHYDEMCAGEDGKGE